MQIGVLGLNHKTATLALREAFARAISSIQKEFPLLILSTCNRSEIYFSVENGAEFHTRLLEELKTVLQSRFEQHLYTFFGRECFLHLSQVCSGLDSAILGECDIKRQVKRAYIEQVDVATKEMHFVFQKSFQIAKVLKERFVMSAWSYDLAHRVKDTLNQHGAQRVLFVGYSAINQQLIKACENVFKIACATRSRKTRCPVEIPDPHPNWEKYDAVVVARHGQVISRTDPIPGLVIDLGVPRNVDPLVDATLYNIDMLQEDVHNHNRRFEQEVELAKQLINSLVDKKLNQFHRYKHYKRIPILSFAQ